MNHLEIIENHPKTTEAAKIFFKEKMSDLLDKENNVSEEFIEFMIHKPIENKDLELYLKENSYVYFPFFDKYDIRINVYSNKKIFKSKIELQEETFIHIKTSSAFREDVNLASVVECFKILEQNLGKVE